MYINVIFLPLISFLTCTIFGRYIGNKGIIIVSIICLFLTFILTLILFYEIGLCNSICNIELFNWINNEFLNLKWGFLFDSLTVSMLLIVNFISLLVHIFSISYMNNDPHLGRFMSYLSLFTFFMLILVTSNNYVQMFLGWEGVGLASYLLISFWFTRLQAAKSALKAIILNRIGDFGLVLSIACIFTIFKTFNYLIIFNTSFFYLDEFFYFFNLRIKFIDFIGIFMFIGAIGKSAQLGLHTWLPDAMEGPTPVSALIHAATMVTAGVFIIIRSSPLIEYSNLTLYIITIIGSLTCFFAATTGLLQDDLKKVIAYSTCSQLGYMIFACGLSNYSVSLFHLMNHAFFKALLFLSAGVIIHALNDEQDMRKMGGLFKLLPFVYVMFLIGSLSLMGFPFLTGFYSKDVILELAFSKYKLHSFFAYWLGSFAAFFTAFYSFRLIYLTFYAKNNSYKKIIENSHEGDIVMSFPLILLAFGSIFIGYIMKDLIIGLGTLFWNNTLFYLPTNINILQAEFLPTFIKLIPIFLSLLGAFFSLFFFFIIHKNFYSKIFMNYKKKNYFFFINLYKFLNKKWYFDYIYNKYITINILNMGYNISFKLIDRGFIEIIGPLGLVRLFNKLSLNISNLQTGYIFNYIFSMIFFILILSSFFIINFFNISISISFFYCLIISFFFFNNKKNIQKVNV